MVQRGPDLLSTDRKPGMRDEITRPGAWNQIVVWTIDQPGQSAMRKHSNKCPSTGRIVRHRDEVHALQYVGVTSLKLQMLQALTIYVTRTQRCV